MQHVLANMYFNVTPGFVIRTPFRWYPAWLYNHDATRHRKWIRYLY